MRTLLTPYSAIETVFDGWHPFRSLTPVEGDANAMPTLRPNVDVHANESEYVIVVDLPGVSKDAVKVEVEDSQLTIRATREERHEKTEPIRVERYARAEFVRSFTLGDAVNATGIKAELKDGVLRVRVPKAERALPRRIAVE